MDDKKVKYDALDAMWAFVRMGGYQLHPADISSLKDHCEQLRHLLTQKTAGQRRDKREDIDFHELDVITNNIVIGAMVLYMSGSLDALTPKEASHHEKSVIEARQRALENSEVAPGILIRVMDKPHQHAVICSHPKVYRERVLDGWHTVAAFRNGEEVKI